jgi:queuine tRNA-ribosyltransferase
MGTIDTAHGVLQTPAYIPDATRGVVRTLDAADLESVRIPAIMVNSFHLASRPGVRAVQQLGGLHRFTGWSGPIVSDSGGFQVFSLIRQDAKFGVIREHEIIFRDEEGGKLVLTPEKCVQDQFRLGADIMMALDDCTGPESPPEEQRAASRRTVQWARRAREEFDRQVEQRRLSGPPPLLVAPVQGGYDTEVRAECAAGLLDAGYRAFGFGGWPLDAEGTLQLEMFRFLSQALPPEAPFFALGVGKPDHLVAITDLGRAAVFDSSLPTRDARHHRLYRFTGDPGQITLRPGGPFYEKLYILDKQHAVSSQPISPFCDALCCRRYATGYLQHLFRCDDPLASRLATIHNLRFYTQLIARLRERGV